MDAQLTMRYDRIGDILYIETRTPYAEQESEELDESVVARKNPSTGEIENLEVLFFSERLKRGDELRLPVSIHMKPAS